MYIHLINVYAYYTFFFHLPPECLYVFKIILKCKIKY